MPAGLRGTSTTRLHRNRASTRVCINGFMGVPLPRPWPHCDSEVLVNPWPQGLHDLPLVLASRRCEMHTGAHQPLPGLDRVSEPSAGLGAGGGLSSSR
jgi:hypothetical protein